MIIEMLLNVIYNLLDLLLIFELPKMPQSAIDYVDEIFNYMVAGAGIIANYTPLDYLLLMFGVILAIDAGIMIYHFVMWIIKKIPMAGVS